MAAAFTAGDPVRVMHRGTWVTGIIWSYGPVEASYWVIPDEPQPDMVQGCIQASLQLMDEPACDALW